MCGIAGFYNPYQDYKDMEGKWKEVLRQMNRAQKHRGPDDDGIYLSDHCGLAQVRLAIIDLETGHQPMHYRIGERQVSAVYNGEIYNMKELKTELEKKGYEFRTSSDTEVLLAGYLDEGPEFIEKCNGIFALALWEKEQDRILLFRDRLGVKPLFYRMEEETLVFGSEMKAIFAFPGIEPQIDERGILELFALGPARSQDTGLFYGICQVLPGHYLEYSKKGFKDRIYWQLESREHRDSFETTVEKTGWLLEDAVRMQMLSDVPVSTFLSGGVDSSLVTAICADTLRREGKVLNTFSFDFEGNNKYFKSNSFQPDQDGAWVAVMADYSQTNHRCLECDNQSMYECLFQAVEARDLPCMADVESSLLYFCGKVVRYNKVTLTGECADEIFGGYPWFHRPQFFEADAFPWSLSMDTRKSVLNDEILKYDLDEYAHEAYKKTIRETPVLDGESPEEKRRREISYLNLKWFMMTLLERMDRTSMYNGLEARVPFADHRIVEYVFNVPWNMKCPGGMVKGLLRKAGEKWLPEEVLYRKKSPYPKTYHPGYEAMLKVQVQKIIENPNSPIHEFVDKKKVEAYMRTPSDYGSPWYGQLMAGPQMLAYLLQINYWMDRYHIQIRR